MSLFSRLLRNTFKLTDKIDPLGSKILQNTQDAPGSPGSLRAAALATDTQSNPYGSGRHRLDIFAGGESQSRKEGNRNLGRAVGTVAALFFGGQALGGGSSSAATTGSGGAATAGTGAAAAAPAAKGILGTGITATEAASVATTIASVDAQKKAAKANAEALARQSETFTDSLDRLRTGTSGPPTIDEARRRSEAANAARRRRGRQASILTGPTGVGSTPISQRSLIGS